MRIDPNKCVACGNCTYVCPMGAIYIDPVIKRATVDRDECVECYACYNGLSQEHLNPTMVRTMRKAFQLLRLRFDPEPDVCPTAALMEHPNKWVSKPDTWTTTTCDSCAVGCSLRLGSKDGRGVIVRPGDGNPVSGDQTTIRQPDQHTLPEPGGQLGKAGIGHGV